MTGTAGKDGYAGQQQLADSASEFNRNTFQTQQLQNLMSTATIVKVLKVEVEGGPGSVSPVGTVDVMPMVNMIDGVGNSFKHGTILKLPYCRIQGGATAVILDPKVGDLGLCVFADRDISKVVKEKGQANPGSRRRNDMADGIYVCTLLGAKPTSYVRFYEDGKKIEASPNEGATRWRLEENKITLTPDDGTTYIELTPGAIKIVGARVDLNP